MPDEQPIPNPSEHDRSVERQILHLLTEPDGRPLWTAEEVERELNQHGVLDCLRPLEWSGLVRITGDEHVFASRAADRFVRIVGWAI